MSSELGLIPDKPLTSWKEIAAFFGRDVRTLQRWEKEEGLPIHRHLHHRQNSVYAYPRELEEWWRTRGLEASEEPGPPALTKRSRWILWAAAPATMVLVGLAAGFGLDHWWQAPPGPPSHGIVSEGTNDARTVANGRTLYMAGCANCHGLDGRAPTEVGRSMYPSASDLGSPGVQQWSDPELFWIIKQGIRLSGMPGFGHIHSDDQIWHLVHFVRGLAPRKNGS